MRGHRPIRLCRNVIAADGVTTLKTQKPGRALSFVSGRSTCAWNRPEVMVSFRSREFEKPSRVERLCGYIESKVNVGKNIDVEVIRE